MRFGVAVPTWGPFADLGALADFLSLVEELGYESAWFADHVAIPPYATDRFDPPMLEPLALAGWALARHERLRIGTDVLVVPYRHPLLVAAMAGSLQRVSAGRLLLGVGIGYLEGEFAALGLPVRLRAPMTDEALDALRTVWSGRGPHTFSGHAFEFHDVLPVAVPPVPVPILVGGNNPNARARAARLGDGWHPLYPSPDDYSAGREEIERLRSHDRITRPFLFSFSAAATVVTERPIDGGGAGPASGDVRPEYRYAPAIPADGRGRTLLCGSRDQVADDVVAYRRAGVEHMVLRVWNAASRFGIEGAMDQLRMWTEIKGMSGGLE
jgi:probable F420-dependent oxidoreductase